MARTAFVRQSERSIQKIAAGSRFQCMSHHLTRLVHREHQHFGVRTAFRICRTTSTPSSSGMLISTTATSGLSLCFLYGSRPLPLRPPLSSVRALRSARARAAPTVVISDQNAKFTFISSERIVTRLSYLAWWNQSQAGRRSALLAPAYWECRRQAQIDVPLSSLSTDRLSAATVADSSVRSESHSFVFGSLAPRVRWMLVSASCTTRNNANSHLLPFGRRALTVPIPGGFHSLGESVHVFANRVA